MKKAELILTQAWQNNAKWLGLLKPLSWLYGTISAHQRRVYEAGKKSSYRAPVPVWVVGNITVGGSGKTPLIISLVRYLQQKGVRVGVISRGYGGDERLMPALVTATSLPSGVGDEPCLIAQSTLDAAGQGVPLAVCPKRRDAASCLLAAHPDIQLIISDDGLQHYALARDVEWIVVDAGRGFGNGALLPAGFLREPVSRLNGANVIYHQSTPQAAQAAGNALFMYLELDSLVPLIADNQDSAPSAGQTVHALSGIGYPVRFFDSVRRLGLSVIEHPMPDHHVFSLADLADLTDKPIITTAKDAVKLRHLYHAHPDAPVFRRIWVLPVQALLSDELYRLIDTKLAAYGIL